MIKFLIEKEFKQLFRNSFLPKLIFIFPCMIMILMPWAANLEIKNINLNIVDNDHSVLSRRLVDKIGASTYFRLTALPDTYDEALLAIEAGSADVVLEIPRDSKGLGEGRGASSAGGGQCRERHEGQSGRILLVFHHQ